MMSEGQNGNKTATTYCLKSFTRLTDEDEDDEDEDDEIFALSLTKYCI